MSEIILSKEQEAAKSKILDSLIAKRDTEAILVGYAGTGKTTLIKSIIKDLKASRRGVVLLTPTAKAGIVLSGKTNYKVSTIHSAIYGGPEIDPKTGKMVFKNPKNYCSPNDVVIVDEASMVGRKVYNDLKNKTAWGAGLLFVADGFQLQPVGDRVGPDLTHPTARLRNVHRQSESSFVLKYATAIRNNTENEFYKSYDFSDSTLRKYKASRAIDWMEQSYSRGSDHIMMCFTNATRNNLNKEMRDLLGLAGSALSIGEKVVVKSNNRNVGLCNGEVLTISDLTFSMWKGEPVYSVEFEESKVLCRILGSSIGSTSSEFWDWKKKERVSPKSNWLHVDYGYALTVHSAQGSQWENIGFAWDEAFKRSRKRDRLDSRRMLYTAITRASKRAAIFG